MRNRFISITVSLVVGLLTIQGAAFAQGTDKHGKTAPSAAQMKKLHGMMPMFSVASAELK